MFVVVHDLLAWFRIASLSIFVFREYFQVKNA